jgi:hypothetical protein
VCRTNKKTNFSKNKYSSPLVTSSRKKTIYFVLLCYFFLHQLFFFFLPEIFLYVVFCFFSSLLFTILNKNFKKKQKRSRDTISYNLRKIKSFFFFKKRKNKSVISFQQTNKKKSMDATETRIAAANRRKQLLQRDKLFKRQQDKVQRELAHKELMYRRHEFAKTGDDPTAAEYNKYYAAAGPGSSWRAREHVSLKHSPRNARRSSVKTEDNHEEIEELERLIQLTKEIKDDISDDDNNNNNQNTNTADLNSGSQEKRKSPRPANSSAANNTSDLLLASSFRIEKIKTKKKEIKPISSALYDRLSFTTLKQSRAEADELMMY